MLADNQEYACQTLNMSPGGAALIAPVSGRIGERVICYLDHFGRIEGQISRVFDGGFAIAFTVPPSKREKLADQLTWHANRSALGVPEGRLHHRIVPKKLRSVLHLTDNRKVEVEIIDLSISGAALRCAAKVEVGGLVTLGHRPSRVARASDSMIAVEFLRLIPIEAFDETIEL